MNLRSDRLMVYMDPPNQGWANKNRFDRTGNVISVLLDGKHTFTSPEVLDYRNFTSGGMGMMAEFIWPDAIDAAKAGERYHKIGVGMVERGPEDVNMHNAFFADCVANEAICEQDGDAGAVFSTKGPMLHGWAYTLERKARVQGNRLEITATLHNQGEKPMNMLEYNHNFVTIDDRPTGPDYAIDLTYDVTLSAEPRGVIRQDGKRYTFIQRPEHPFFLTSDDIADAPAYGWTLTHAADGMSISETVSEKPGRTAMWGLSHVISTEVFVPIALEPGQSKTWTRTWVFGA